MIYGSVCSGIEAASVAWEPLGWKPSFFSEIEKFPRDVLAHHYPETPLHGDFTTIKKDDYEPIELLVGGTPCQSFSVAGLRAGLNDPRGNLMLEFGALANRLQPKWLVWENVPGVLSSNDGKDFGSFLAMLAELGYGFAYRVLDAQHFGVPQRRRRVFVIGCLGDWRSAATVLFERDSLQGNPPPSRGKGQEIAGTLTRGFGDRGLDLDQIAGGGYALQTFDRQSSGEYGDAPVASTMSARDYKSPSDLVTYALAGNTIGRRPENGGNGTGYDDSGVSYTLTKTDLHAVAFGHQNSPSQGMAVDTITPTLDKSKTPAVMSNMQVRRLLPIECERLQGFPEITKQVNITICLDLQNSHVDVESQNHKLQKLAGNVEKTASKETALSAMQNMNAKNPKHSKPVVLSAHINLEHLTLQIHNQEKLLLSVNLAEKKSSFPQLTQIENIARSLVQLLKELDQKALNGRAVSQQNIKPSIHLQNGSASVILCGQEIEELASDVELFTTKASDYLKSITSEAGQNSQNCEQHLRTLCCFATAAINTFIQEVIQTKSSYELNLQVSHGYTNIPGASDSPRYKALGNSMAVPVMAWIGERIQKIEGMKIELSALPKSSDVQHELPEMRSASRSKHMA